MPACLFYIPQLATFSKSLVSVFTNFMILPVPCVILHQLYHSNAIAVAVALSVSDRFLPQYAGV
ncbi:hypothetical protein T4D_9727 [Trichinella pseudospiralis]|uniref:Uncharacterized protein n=1 Tax=Trichinella pseudospiralis TaxID=6337 RepID=A0A0V1F6D3_TRIPS|nr:hypothetical protein T4D_9727 [Trichinella pseudospiralis]